MYATILNEEWNTAQRLVEIENASIQWLVHVHTVD